MADNPAENAPAVHPLVHSIFSVPPGCAPLHRPTLIWLVPILVVALLWFTPLQGNGELSWDMANQVAALAGLFLLALTPFIGPLSKTFPKTCGPWRCHRKFLGLSGVAIILFHVVVSVVLLYKLDVYRMFLANAKWTGFYAALTALLIFLAMALTSSVWAVKKMGYRNWKALQMLGYAALTLAIFHFIIFETKKDGTLDVSPLGWTIMAMAVLALAARALIWLAGIPGRKKFEEHVSHPEEKTNGK